MPEQPPPKAREHPWRTSGGVPSAGPAPQACVPSEPTAVRRAAGRYVELGVTSNFSFLRGGSHPEEFVEQAAALGYRAIAVTDRHTLAGIVRAHVAAKEKGIRFLVGSRIEVGIGHEPSGSASAGAAASEGGVDAAASHRSCRRRRCEMLLHPTCLASYGRLSRLLTIGKRRAPKGQCWLELHDLLEYRDGLLCTLLLPRVLDGPLVELIEGLARAFGSRLSIAITRLGDADDAMRSQQLCMLSEWTGVPLLATNDAHYHLPSRRPLQDVLTCIRLGCTLDEAGRALFPNAERHLRGPERMAATFADLPAALERAGECADLACGFSLDALRYRYPSEVVPPGRSPMDHLRHLTWAGARERYPDGLPDKVLRQIEHEFRLIDELQYATYFLTVQDIVLFARQRGILCQGRGAAANSAVCYCLGVTAVDPSRIDVLFERFVSKERNEPPDIDIDFEHERREEVIQYLYAKYGRDRAALAAEVISYRGRSAVRDVGKALGLSLDCVERLASGMDWWHDGAADPERARDVGLNPRDPTIRRLASLSTEVLGFPRHLSQHVGGFVITEGPLCEFVPIENAAMEDRTVIEWDKDDIDAMGMLKVDVLGLGMLTCIRKSIDLVNADRTGTASIPQPAARPAPACGRSTPASVATSAAKGAGRGEAKAAARTADASRDRPPDPTAGGSTLGSPAHRALPEQQGPIAFHTIPAEDAAVYDMVCAADTIGVFQIESRAQMSMLPRLRPRSFYDLVIEVAIVRPGPIQGDMVHPYLRRRNGEEPVVFPDDAVRAVLGKTLGVPLFQEQAMALAIVAAGFTPGEADQLRRAIAAWKRKGSRLQEFAAKLEQGMVGRGYTRSFAQQVFTQIQGFSGYGFPESHAASFALLVYVSAWLKCHQPAAFGAALINSQPMGFYAPAQIVRDLAEHGVTVRGVDVNASHWDCGLERVDPLERLPLRLPDGDPCAVWRRSPSQDAAPPGRTTQRAARRAADDAAEGEAEATESVGGWWPLDPRSVGRRNGKDSEVRRHGPTPRERERERQMLLRDPSMCVPAGKRSVAFDQPSLRLGLRLVRGLSDVDGVRIAEAVDRAGPFHSVHDLWRASGVSVSALRKLAFADAFRSMGLDRQHALWQIQALRDEPLPIFDVTTLSEVPGNGQPGNGQPGNGQPGNGQASTSRVADRTARSHAQAMPESVDRPDPEATAIRHRNEPTIGLVHPPQIGAVTAVRQTTCSGNMDGEAASGGCLGESPSLAPPPSDAMGGVGSLPAHTEESSQPDHGVKPEQPARSSPPAHQPGPAPQSDSPSPDRWRQASIGRPATDPPRSQLPPVSDLAAVAHDYESIGLSLKRHPIACIRARLASRGAVPCGALANQRLTPQGTSLAVAGVVLVRQRPATANGILFMTVEDESGIANLIIRPKVYAAHRLAARHGVIVIARGVVERRDDVVHLLVRSLEDASTEAHLIDVTSRDFH